MKNKSTLKDYHRCIHCDKRTPNGHVQWEIAKYLKENGETESRYFLEVLKINKCSLSLAIKGLVNNGIAKRRYKPTKGICGVRCLVSLL